ncbi:MAG: DUF4215 domain-containing protein [Myxococcales bacterium]|nr:DUF4215 domain-containing protein [Myxococcales bacterium]
MTPLRPHFSCIVPTIVLLSGCFPGLPAAEETTGTTDPATAAADPTTTGSPNAETTGGPNAETTGSPNAETTGDANAETTGGPNAETADESTSEAPMRSFCGDGVLDGGEECDLGVDQNGIGGAACRETCELNVCGDGYIAGDEACDDGNKAANDGCGPGCALEECGDGVVQTGEGCDDGNGANTDECLNTCEPAVCGDGYVQAGVEDCDDANDIDTDSCVDCKDAFCGDGIKGPGEACDDGNKVDNDACSNECALAGCGDGVVQPPEECDDGNTVQTDMCLNSCKQAKCGDGVVQAGVEQCDDGANNGNTKACKLGCTKQACGDGFVGPDEQCDDGDTNNDNACSNSCELRCGNEVIDTGEDCDDGNDDNWFCNNTCKRSGLVVFVTSAKYDGNLKGGFLSGLAGADAKCNSAAAGLLGAGTYVAWLSDQTGSGNAEDRTTPVPSWAKNLPYRTLNGVDVVDHFWNAGALKNPINVTQTGQVLLPVDGDTCDAAAERRVWTGTTNSGTWIGPNQDCKSWTSGFNVPGNNVGRQGRVDKKDGTWTQWGDCDCKSTARLYCVETPK